MTKTLGLFAAVALLAACSPAEKPVAPADAAPPAPAAPQASAPAGGPTVTVKVSLEGVDLAKPIRALGTEPFWGLDASEARGLVLTGVDRPELVAPKAAVAVNDKQATLSGQTADGRTLTLVLSPGPCSDGMSDRTYPLSATVTVGTEILKGCAASTEALARAGESGEVR